MLPFQKIWANLVFLSSVLVALLVTSFLFIVIDFDKSSLNRLKEETVLNVSIEMQQAWERQAAELTDLLALHLAEPIYRLDAAAVRALAEGAAHGKDVVNVYVHDREGRFLVDTTRGKSKVGELPTKPFARRAVASEKKFTQRGLEFVEIASPVLFGTEKVGTVRVEFSVEGINTATERISAMFERKVDDSMEKTKENTILLSITALFVTVAAGAYFAHRLSSPLRELTAGTVRIASGDLSYRAPIRTDDEVGQLARSLNTMTEHLEKVTVSKDYVDNIIKNMMGCLILAHPDGNISSVNHSTVELLGYEEKVLVGLHINSIFDEENYPDSERVFQKMKDQGVRQVEAALRSHDGRKVPVLLSGSVILDTHGNEQGIVCVALDITGRKEAENAIQGYVRQLEQSNHLMTLFTDILSHDLLNPANLISSMTSLLLQNEQPGNREELGLILRNSEKLTQLIRDASDYARVEKVESLAREEVDLFVMISSVIERLRPHFDDRGMQVTIERRAEAPLRANPMVEDVFANLLSNTLKYTPEGSPVKVAITDDKLNWLVTVADKGDGVPDPYKEAIFERFTRMEKKGVRGSGLGLAIARRLVLLHEGEIWVEDRPGGGSIFSVRLPKKSTFSPPA